MAATPPSRRSEAYFLRDRPNDQSIHDETINPSRPNLISPSQERILLLSHSPGRRRKPLILVPEEGSDIVPKPRRRPKNRPAAGPRARRRLEKEISTNEEKPVKEQNKGRENKICDGFRETVVELVMWRNLAKSSLWFGLGTVLFSSSWFSRDFDFCFVSAVSNLGLVLLAWAFIRDSVPRREEEVRRGFRIEEEDIVRFGRLILPAVNVVIAAIQEIFSGDPSTTLMVAPVLLLTAKYGHWITPWRVLSLGFFLGFTAPKLYSTYANHINQYVSVAGNWIKDGWEACRRRRLLGAFSALTLWNLLNVKTRIIAAFICLVLLRYYRQRATCQDNGQKTADDIEVDLVQEQKQDEDLPKSNEGDKTEEPLEEAEKSN